MAFTFLDLQVEVKRRAVRSQGGTQWDIAVQNLLNTSLFRTAREAPWKQLRRKTTVASTANYTTGTLTATNLSNSYTFVTSTLITQGIQVGQRINISGSSQRYVITAITSNTACTTNLNYDGTTGAAKTFTIYGREEYNLPIECDRVGLVWHENFGYPYLLDYVTDPEFYETGVLVETGNTPTHYRMWGENSVLSQPLTPGVLRIASSTAGDTSITITVFGMVSGYPDFEAIVTNASNGTTAVSGSKSFQSVERVTKSATSTGRITIDSDTATNIVAVLPVGDTTATIQYKKFQVWPLPSTVFNFNIQYYKQPYRLVGDNDIHELGQEYDEAIICLAIAKIKAENSQSEAQFWMELYMDELKTLRRVNGDKLDWLPTLKRPRDSRARRGLYTNGLTYNQLGGSYGPTSWR